MVDLGLDAWNVISSAVGGSIGRRRKYSDLSSVSIALFPLGSVPHCGNPGGVEFKSPAMIVGTELAVARFAKPFADSTRSDSLRCER